MNIHDEASLLRLAGTLLSIKGNGHPAKVPLHGRILAIPISTYFSQP